MKIGNIRVKEVLKLQLVMIVMVYVVSAGNSMELGKSNKFLGMNENKFSNDSAGVGGASSNSTNSANSANTTSSNSTNNKVITAAPFRVTQCDQVIQIKAKTLLDYNDFSQKGDSVFTISVYMVNQFESANGDTLKNSFTMDKIISRPQVLPGSVSCVDIEETSSKKFAICLPTKEEANQLIKAFSQFMKCRMGDNLKNTPARTVKSIMKASCLGLDVSFDVNKFGGDYNKAKSALKKAMDQALRNAAIELKKSVKKPGEEVDPMEVMDKNPSAGIAPQDETEAAE